MPGHSCTQSWVSLVNDRPRPSQAGLVALSSPEELTFLDTEWDTKCYVLRISPFKGQYCRFARTILRPLDLGSMWNHQMLGHRKYRQVVPERLGIRKRRSPTQTQTVQSVRARSWPSRSRLHGPLRLQRQNSHLRHTTGCKRAPLPMTPCKTTQQLELAHPTCRQIGLQISRILHKSTTNTTALTRSVEVGVSTCLNWESSSLSGASSASRCIKDKRSEP